MPPKSEVSHTPLSALLPHATEALRVHSTHTHGRSTHTVQPVAPAQPHTPLPPVEMELVDVMSGERRWRVCTYVYACLCVRGSVYVACVCVWVCVSMSVCM